MDDGIDQHQLAQLIQLLQLAHSSDNHAQAQVFQALKALEEQPTSYTYLAFIFAHEQLPLPLRKMAGLTLSSSLKRNKNALHFEPPQLTQIKRLLLQSRGGELQRVRSMAISELVNRHDFDFELFGELISGVGDCRENVGMANIILEDIRFNNENYNVFDDARFAACMEALYRSLLALLLQDLSTLQDPFLHDYLRCLNLLTFHCPARLYSYLASFLTAVIAPLLALSASQPLSPALLQLCLDGLNEIVATKYSLVPSEMVEAIAGYCPRQPTAELLKTWSNIMIEVIENAGEEGQRLLPIVVPRAIEGLAFTASDERNIKEEMEVEYNPYGDGEDAQEIEEEGDILEASYGGTSGYTLRKLSFQLLEKAAIHHSEGFWAAWAPLIATRIRSPQPAIAETAVSFIGIVAETCMHEMGELEQWVRLLLELAAPRSSTLLRATSLWALEKLLPAFSEQDHLVIACLAAVFEAVNAPAEGTHTAQLMLKEAAVSLLDEVLSLEGVARVVSPQLTQQAVATLLNGLRLFRGRALFSVFKALSTIFQSPHFRSVLSEGECDSIVGALCGKWGQGVRSDSVMCPLLECLVSAAEGMQHHLAKFSPELFAQLLPLLRQTERKQLVLRAIDLLSSLVGGGSQLLTPCVMANEFQSALCGLLSGQEKEVRHFAYSLVSALGKNYQLGGQAEQLLVLVAQTMDEKSLTSRNNALTCLADLLQAYPALRPNYLPAIFAKVAEVALKEELPAVYAFNFARVIGRLCLLDPAEGRRQLQLHPALLTFAFLSLRTREVSRLTSDSFRGLLAVVGSFSAEQLLPFLGDMESVLEALVCYPLRQEENIENVAVGSFFAEFTRGLRAKVGEAAWEQLLQRPIFLPAAVRTLTAWSTSLYS